MATDRWNDLPAVFFCFQVTINLPIGNTRKFLTEVIDMSLIKIDHLTFAYPGSYENVFENCSFQIDSDWKLGFVGRNGRGKTTLLRLLQGQYEYSGGQTGSPR